MPFFGFSNSDLQKWSSGKVGFSGHMLMLRFKRRCLEVDDSIKASMQRNWTSGQQRKNKKLDVLDRALNRCACSAGRPIAQRPLFRGRDFSISKLG